MNAPLRHIPQRYFTAHAVDRAWERYGLALSAEDMREILRACHDGRASRMVHTSTGEHQFLFTFKGQMMVPVLSGDLSLIITFAPGDAFTAGTTRKRFGTKQVPKTPKSAAPDRYNRARENRRAIEEVED